MNNNSYDMKQFLLSVLLLSSALGLFGKDKKHPLMASDTVVWCGLDFSMVRLIGTNSSLKNPVF